MSVLPQTATEQPGSLSFPYRDAQRFFCFYYRFKVVSYLCSFLPQSAELPWFPREKLTRKYNLCLPRSLTFPEKRNQKKRLDGIKTLCQVSAFFIRMRCLDGVRAHKSLSTSLAPALISLSGFSPHQKKTNKLLNQPQPQGFSLKTHLEGKSPGDKVDLWASAEEKVVPE